MSRYDRVGQVLGRTLTGLLCLLGLSGCMAMAVTGAVVGATTAVVVEVVELPFEVAGGVYDVVTDDEDDEDED